MSKLSFKALADDAESSAKPEEKKHVDVQTKSDFQQLKDKVEGSKAEITMVSFRMTKAERRSLRAMAAQLEMPIQDIMREALALFKAKQGVR